MLYWLIPYLVAYNASDSGNWNYGPEHLFKAEVRSNIAIDNVTLLSDINIFISCRPLNSSFIQCLLESTTTVSREFITGSENGSTKHESHEEFAIGNIIFQVEFDKMGPRNVTLLNTKGRYREDMMRAIFDGLNIGTDLSDKKPGKNYFFKEKSIINGICETSFDIRTKKLPYEEKEPVTIEGFIFDVPSFPERENNETIIIEKKRKVNECLVRPSYFFGGDELDVSLVKRGAKIENIITRSRTILFLGKSSFSSYTENEGTTELKGIQTSKMNNDRKFVKGKVVDTIRLKLVAIRPATEKL